MERFQSLGPVGEGSYGSVLKCRHRDSGRLVAIKKFLDSDDDRTVKKIALREIRLLRQLRHDNLVNLLEVWRRRRRWYLVFEFVDRTLLDVLEQNPDGLELNTGRRYFYQILRAANFCHQQNVIHRDIKPENVLISQEGVVKLCDFGFARTMAAPPDPGVYTDYVATRWYRAPELLVGDAKYGKPVDVWAVGCLLIEMLTAQPLFPGESDLDQIHHIIRCFGNLTTHHQELFYRNPGFSGVKLPECSGTVPLQQRFPAVPPAALDLAKRCLEMDPGRRAQCSELLEHPLFTQDSFHIRFLDDLNAKIKKEHRENSTLPEITRNPRRERDEGDEKNCRSKDKKLVNPSEKMSKDKMERTKGKQPSKVSKTNCNASQRLLAKRCKALGQRATCIAAQSSTTVKWKPGKAAGAELRKRSDVSKHRKTLISESADATKNTASLKNKNPKAAKPQHETVVPPEPRKDPLTDVRADGLDTEKNIIKMSRLYKSEPSPEFAETCSNSKVRKPSENPITHREELNLSPKTALKTVVDQTNTSIIYHLSINNPIDVTASTLVFPLKTCKKTVASEFQRTETQQRSSLCPKVLTLNYKTTSNCGPKSTKNSSSLLTDPSKTPTSDLSVCLSTICMDASPAHTTAAPPKKVSEVSKTGCTFKKALSKVQEDRGDLRIHRGTKMNKVTETGPDVSQTSSGVDPGSQRTKISREGRVTSTSMPNENKPSPVLRLRAASDKENQEDLTTPMSVSSTMKLLTNQTVSGSSGEEKKNNCSDFDSYSTSFKVSHPKHGLIKPGYFGINTTYTVPPKTMAETHYPTKTSAAEDSTSVTSADRKASTRSFFLRDSDATAPSESDFSLPQSSPPPSLLLPPSSTSPTSSHSVVNSNSPAASHRLTEGAALNQCLRCVDVPRHHGGICGRQAQQFVPSSITGSFPFKVSENTPLCEQSFPSDHGNHGNHGNVSSFTEHGTQNLPHVHFPDLRSSTLLELRGREGIQTPDGIRGTEQTLEVCEERRLLRGSQPLADE